jgi:thiosulfate/3-mercaptopyruvate sulfurtransferase
MTHTSLIDTKTLASRLLDPAVAIVDCRFDLKDPASGEREYAARHIPGASYASLDADMSGEKTGRNGRHPLPDPDALVRTFSRLGIDGSTQVVAYDQDTGIYASRLWWLLRWLGHDAVAVLDGGFAKWLHEDLPTRSGVERRAPRPFAGTPRPGWVVNVDEVARASQEGGLQLVDARAPERFRGENETIDKVGGHIPGARNHFSKWNLTDENTFQPSSEIRDRIRESIGDVSADRVISYCGSGVTACHNLLAFEHAGLRGARLFVGSWSEWSSDPARPIER